MLAAVVLAATVPATRAGDAIQSGYWNDPSTWKSGVVPTANESVSIGTTAGAKTATVTLDGNAVAYGLQLGYYGHGTLDLGDSHLSVSHALTLGVTQGSTGTITRGAGSFSAQTLNVRYGNSLTMGSGDRVGNVDLEGGGSLTTAATGNIYGDVYFGHGGTLNLGADLVSTDTYYSNGSIYGKGTLNANGHDITADSLSIGAKDITLVDRGDLKLSSLDINGPLPDFNLTASDAVSHLNLDDGAETALGAGVQVNDITLYRDSSATITETGNVSKDYSLNANTTLNLEADLKLATGSSDTSRNTNGTINANGHDITGGNLRFSGSAASILNDGDIKANYALELLDKAGITLDGLGDSARQLVISAGSTLTLMQKLGDSTGFTLSGSGSTDLNINAAGTLALMFADTPGDDWLFRWAGSHSEILDSLLADGRITVDSSWGYEVAERDGYTYIMRGGAPAAVPEPSSLAMLGAGMAVGLGALARRRKAAAAA